MRKLSKHGLDALRPSVRIDEEADKRIWAPPPISNRLANGLRKQTIKDGTYGSFDSETGIGWDPQWDVELAKAKPRGSGRYRQRVPKNPSRVRNREQRAQRIEQKMEGMDERMEEYLAEKNSRKPEKTFENLYKKLMKGSK